MFNGINLRERRKIKRNLKFKIIMNVLIKELNEMDTKLLKLIFIKLPILYFSNKIMHGIYTYLI